MLSPFGHRSMAWAWAGSSPAPGLGLDPLPLDPRVEAQGLGELATPARIASPAIVALDPRLTRVAFMVAVPFRAVAGNVPNL